MANTTSRKKGKRPSLSGASASSETNVVLREGQILSGRYRIVEKIGTGGMGVVYKVEDEKLDNKQFALKALPPDMSKSTAAIKRLKKEALAAIEMHHGNIMALHSFDDDGQQHFLIMELLDGPDLENALVDKERFSVEEVIDVARQVCPALEYAHERGIVHRDIKPSNLIYKTEGNKRVVKIADFGIAYQVRNSIARLTGQDTTGGTLHYMPPEQLAGKDVDARADQYAFSATLYELLRGRPPFEGAGAMLMRQIDETSPDAIDGIPKHVNAALVKGLSKKPEDRFDSCGQLLEALEGKTVTTTIGSQKRIPATETGKSVNFSILVACLLLMPLLVGVEYSQGYLGIFKTASGTKHSATQAAPTKAPIAATKPTAEKNENTTTTTKPVVTAPNTKETERPVVTAPKKLDIAFSSTPAGAKVYCYETMPPFIGKTTEPFSKAFKPGKYRFKFANMPGYRDTVIPFEVSPDGKQELKVVLKEQKGSVIFKVSPSDAKVTVGGLPYSGGRMALKPKKYKFSVSKEGYQKRSGRIIVSDGMVKTFEINLKIKPEVGSEKTVAGMTFCWCPPGEFMMGSPKDEAGRDNDEGPQHKVRITKGFWLGKYEVTIGQWKKLMGSYLSDFKDHKRPVRAASWNDCQNFINKMTSSLNDKYKFRLPTEAEWEYACRANTTTAFHFGHSISDDQASFDASRPYEMSHKGIDRKNTSEVGSFPPNAWGLHDMHGNVYEWCSDWLSDNYENATQTNDPTGPKGGSLRVVRSGSFSMKGNYCRSASRYGFPPHKVRYRYLGFRVLLEN